MNGQTFKIKLPAVPKKANIRMLPSLYEASPYEQGFAKGYSEGWDKANADCTRIMEERIKASRAHWDAIAKSLNQFPMEIAQKLREQLVTLAFNTVQKILLATPITREEVAAQIKQMLEHVESSSEIEVQLNPEDLALLTEEDKGSLWNEEFTHLKWNANPGIPRGGCMLRGEFGWTDGRRATKINKLQQLAEGAVKDNPA